MFMIELVIVWVIWMQKSLSIFKLKLSCFSRSYFKNAGLCVGMCRINSVKITSILKYFPELKFLLRFWSAVRSLKKISFVNLAFQLSAYQLWIKLEFLARYSFRQNNFSSLLFTAWYSSVIALNVIAACGVRTPQFWTVQKHCCRVTGRKGLVFIACDSINPIVYSVGEGNTGVLAPDQ